MNSTDLTLKKMFDITSKLVSDQEEINNLDKIHWERNSWKQLSDWSTVNQRAKVYVFSDSVLCLGNQHPESKLGSRGLNGSQLTKTTETMTDQWRADRVRVEYFPRIHCVAALR